MRISVLCAFAVLFGALSPVCAQTGRESRSEIMVVGVAHLVAKADLHNATWGSSAFTPQMQSQIKQLVNGLARFKPTKVMIEARANNPIYVQRYLSYRARQYQLGANEDDQFGYRLAGLLNLPTIYPIDSVGTFPFDYDRVRRAAWKFGETSVLKAADAELRPLVEKTNALERSDNLLALMRYMNTPSALAINSGWYMYINSIGNASIDYSGQVLTSFWYARNLQILANITHDLKPADRVVVFIGQGHAAMLRQMIKNSPYLADVDPEPYL